MLYDQPISVVRKIQNYYHRYYNNLFHVCNIKKLTNVYKRRHKYSKRNKHRNKYLTNTISNVLYYNNNFNNENNYKKNSSLNKNIRKSKCDINNDRSSYWSNVDNMCHCEESHGHRNYKKYFKLSYQITHDLYHYCYFQKNYHSLRLLIVIFLLSFLTTTAHSIEHTQEKPQRKSNHSTSLPSKPLTRPLPSSALSPPQPFLSTLTLASLDVLSGGTFKSLTDTINLPCYHNSSLPNASLNLRFNENHNFKSRICYNRRHLRHLHSKFKRSSSIQNERFMNKNQINYLHHHHHQHHHHQHHNHYNSSHHDRDDQNNSNTFGDLHQITNYTIDSKVAKFENILLNNNSSNITSYNNNVHFKKEEKEEEEEEEEDDYKNINNLNISQFLNHIRLNDKNYKQNNDKTKDKNNILSNYTLRTNGHENVENYGRQDKAEVKKINTNNKTYRVYVENSHHNNDDDFDYDDDDKNYIKEEKSKLFNLLPTVTAATSSFKSLKIYANPRIRLKEGKEEYIDYQRLMKLVMNGLDLKKLPDMKNINISQKEYATKYQEYLQRVRARQKRYLKEELYDYDESFFRPLQFFSIISNSSLLGQEYGSYNEDEDGRLRQKRHAMESDDNEQSKQHGERSSAKVNDGNKNVESRQTLEERVKNILFLRKKYQKPRSTKQQRDERKTNTRLMFAFKPDISNLSSSDIEEANTRLVLIHSPILAIRNSIYKKTNVKKNKKLCGSRTNTNEGQKGKRQMTVLNLKLYFMPKVGKRTLLDAQKVNIHFDQTKPDETHTQWLQFDVTKAVKFALDDKRLQHVAFELQCDKCKRVGARILDDAYNTAADAQAADTFPEDYQLMPVLNIIGRFERAQHSLRPHKNEGYRNDDNTYEGATTTQRHYHHQNYNKSRHNRRTNCYKSNQRCCRHSMEVTFKEIKGFEFIIQPKIFDAGYCHGRCPPRYNPAHHHAMLQSLIWKQNHNKAPRPCCAPSKLVELEVLHVDEKDSEKLKISTWSDMKVVECACS